MRLLNVMTADGPHLGIVKDGRTLDLTRKFADEGLEVRQSDDLIRLYAHSPAQDLVGAPPLIEGLPVLPAVLHPEKIACAGLNYLEHARHAHLEPPESPCFFAKYTSALNGHGGTITPPRGTTKLDYEGELAVVIGEGGRDIPEDDVYDHIFGVACANDVSARDLQFRTSQWLAGKTCDGFLPLGPCLVTLDEAGDPQDLRLRTWRNGGLVQDTRTSDMIFSIRRLIAELSHIVTLSPGDVVLTGTPSGPQTEKADPDWLRDGDVVSVEIEGLGRLENTIRMP